LENTLFSQDLGIAQTVKTHEDSESAFQTAKMEEWKRRINELQKSLAVALDKHTSLVMQRNNLDLLLDIYDNLIESHAWKVKTSIDMLWRLRPGGSAGEISVPRLVEFVVLSGIINVKQLLEFRITEVDHTIRLLKNKIKEEQNARKHWINVRYGEPKTPGGE
jgi:hypothetical protein